MSTADPSELRAVAEEACRRAGRVLTEKLRAERVVEFKRGIDPVTDADRASEAELLGFLRAARPHDAILAEESGLSAGADLRWLVDPLDGTANYARGIPVFCVSVAVEGPEGVLAGAVFDPNRDELFSAARGQGATLNGAPIRTSQVAALDQAVLCVGFPFDVRLRPEPTATLVQRLLRRAHGLLRTGSAALNLAYVACGRYDGHAQLGLHAWDVAAGALLVSEAGGSLSLLDGAPFQLAAGDLIGCNQPLTGTLRAECRAALEEARWSRGAA